MPHILTLVSSSPEKPLTAEHIEHAAVVTQDITNHDSAAPHWIEEQKAAEISLIAPPEDQKMPFLNILREKLATDKIDVFLTPKAGRIKKLLLADMDSTIVTGETLDDLAEFAGIKDEVAAITARAMNGELDFHAAIRERVGLLKGLSTQAMNKTLDAIALSPGAKEFITTMRNNGVTCVLVSGGFTFFTAAIAEKVGFHHNHGNTLGIDEKAQSLTGEVIPPILDKHAKVDFLKLYMEKLNLQPEHCLTIGDGANDIPMLDMAQKGNGLGIGYHPKPAVTNTILNQIVHGDLSAALYAQGLKPA
ncbi:MAG: phosphoserine phosphatase SerB [Alphaproteobacteria bacterium]|nr:phosphoserine phosphatase SerB [Alphaproteobacteria bacterium]